MPGGPLHDARILQHVGAVVVREKEAP